LRTSSKAWPEDFLLWNPLGSLMGMKLVLRDTRRGVLQV
jgi:hypothetical protein